jgi:hypothetical protein
MCTAASYFPAGRRTRGTVASARADWEDRRVGRILALVLGLAALAFAAKTMLAGTAIGNAAGPTQPKRQLDSVRLRAKQIEREQQNAADRVARKLEEQ